MAPWPPKLGKPEHRVPASLRVFIFPASSAASRRTRRRRSPTHRLIREFHRNLKIRKIGLRSRGGYGPWVNWSWFKPMKSGRKQLPVINPTIGQKLEWQEAGGKDAEKAVIMSTGEQKFSGSSNGIVDGTSGHPSRPEATILPTQTAGDSTADQSQQKANFRPNRSESHETVAIREIQEATAAPERQAHVPCSRDPATTSSENNSTTQRPSAHNKQKPSKCPLSPVFSRNPVNRARKKSVYELGPMVGMSIVLVSLTSLLLCGRLCSIFWTSACLCLVPRLRKRKTTHGAGSKREGQAQLDVDSDEYKKMVIMEGMLKRNHKNRI